ncbi:MAG TPA: metalloregulator ArsR/SmtB family transcription factor [Oxalicibacterium sp.]|jgi:ArsR family transcriptional regulator|nr:metalloregulator ArsR/SmtB family transcription factor [Oxalicibacterium sp.]
MNSQTTVIALAALAQESRLAIFRLLVRVGPEGMAATRIGDKLGIAPSSMSFHLKELAHAGLVSVRRDGRSMIYSANFDEMNALVGYLTENCCGGNACTPARAKRPSAIAKA